MAKKKEKIAIATNKSFKIEEDTYFRASIDGMPVVGTVDGIDEYSFILNWDQDEENDEYREIYFDSKTPGTISEQELLSEDITSFKLLNKVEYNKLLKEYKNRFVEVFGYNAKPKKVDGELGYSFGCGAVELTNTQIQDFLIARSKLSKKEWNNMMSILEDIRNHDGDLTEIMDDDGDLRNLAKSMGFNVTIK